MDDLRSLSTTYHNIATIETAFGKSAKAIELLLKSLAIKEQLGDIQGQGNAFLQLAQVKYQLNQTVAAKDALLRAINIYEQIEDKYSLSIALFNLAQILETEKNYNESLALLQRVFKIQTQLKIPDAADTQSLILEIEKMKSSLEQEGHSDG